MKSLFIFLFAFGVSVFGYGQSQDSVWLFSYFKKNGEDGLHLAYSKDGFHWSSLRNDSSFLTPAAGFDKLMRDPCIIYGADGKFHMVWTASWKEKGIGYASSSDLINWSPQQYLEVMKHEENAQNCWAPEITYDPEGKEYMIYWATTITGRFPATDTLGDHDHRMYYITTKDFKEFSKAKLLYDQGFNVIDATIFKQGGQFVMVLKDETLKPKPEKNLRIAYSTRLTSGYGKPSLPITGDYWAEGPTVTKVDGQFVVYFDKYRDGHYGAIASRDLKSWTDISERISVPAGMRHGSIFKVSRKQFEALTNANKQ